MASLIQRKGKKQDGGKGWRKSGVSERTLRSGVSREINSRSSSFVNFVAVRGLYYLVPVRSLYDSRGGIACEKERERREIKRKSGGRLLGRFLKGRKLCIANKRIGQRRDSAPRGNLRISRGNSSDVFALPPPPVWRPVSCARHGSL